MITISEDYPITPKAIVRRDLNQLLRLSSLQNLPGYEMDIKAYFYIIFFELNEAYISWKLEKLRLGQANRSPSVFVTEYEQGDKYGTGNSCII